MVVAWGSKDRRTKGWGVGGGISDQSKLLVSSRQCETLSQADEGHQENC